MKIRRDSLDVLFSEFIRRRAIKEAGGCECCHSQKQSYKQLQVSHFHGRRKQSVRFDIDNAAGLCYFCHQHFTENPLGHVEFFKNRLGERDFEMLEVRAMRPQKVDIWAVTLYLQNRIKELLKEGE